MSKIGILIMGLIALAGHSPGPRPTQNPVVITFEDQSGAGPIGEGVRVTVTDQYAGLGALFNGPAVFDYSTGLSAVPGFAHSPARAVVQCYGAEFCSTPFVIRFTTPQRRVKVWVGYAERLQQNGTALLAAYTAAGVLVGQDSAVIPPSDVPRIGTSLEFVSGSDDIEVVNVRSPDLPPAGFALDDVEFAVGPPPEPQAPPRLVPPLIGLSQDEAIAVVERESLVLGDITVRETTDVSPGLVVEQTPQAGDTAAAGTRVDLVLAQAAAQPVVTVPEPPVQLPPPSRPPWVLIVTVAVIVVAIGGALVKSVSRPSGHPPPVPQPVLELASDGLEAQQVQQSGPLEFRVEIQITLAADESDQVITGGPPAIRAEKRLP